MREIELKVFADDELFERVKLRTGVCVSKEEQLNHYFKTTEINDFLVDSLLEVASLDFCNQLAQYIDRKVSIRTRKIGLLPAELSDLTILFAKISLRDGESAVNGTNRVEIRQVITKKIEDVDKALEGFLEVDSKWRRYRENYKLGDVTISLENNSGYGKIAEFEIEADETQSYESVREALEQTINLFGVLHKTVPQDLLEEMYKVYSENWDKFYDSMKTFADFDEYKHLRPY